MLACDFEEMVSWSLCARVSFIVTLPEMKASYYEFLYHLPIVFFSSFSSELGGSLLSRSLSWEMVKGVGYMCEKNGQSEGKDECN